MAIRLFTGTPGAGKTLRSIFEGMQKKVEGRNVVHIGIDGMNSDMIPEFKPGIENWKELAPGSILIVDEAHKFLPVRSPGKPPQWIQDLTEIRHSGIELWLVSQDPRNLDSFVRRLIGEHVHVSRKAGLNAAMVRVFQGVSEDPNDFHAQKSSTVGPWKYPKHLFQSYKSATLHVVKPKIPLKIIFACIVILCLPIALYFAIDGIRSVGDKDDGSGSSPASSSLAFGSVAEEDTSSPWDSPEAFVKAHEPILPGIPISAPVFKDRPVVNFPRLFCYLSGYPGSDECKCKTEQLTKVSVPEPVCRSIVSDGLYDPYTVFPSPQAGEVGQGASMQAPGLLPPSPSVVIPSTP